MEESLLYKYLPSVKPGTVLIETVLSGDYLYLYVILKRFVKEIQNLAIFSHFGVNSPQETTLLLSSHQPNTGMRTLTTSRAHGARGSDRLDRIGWWAAR